MLFTTLQEVLLSHAIYSKNELRPSAFLLLLHYLIKHGTPQSKIMRPSCAKTARLHARSDPPSSTPLHIWKQTLFYPLYIVSIMDHTVMKRSFWATLLAITGNESFKVQKDGEPNYSPTFIRTTDTPWNIPSKWIKAISFVRFQPCLSGDTQFSVEALAASPWIADDGVNRIISTHMNYTFKRVKEQLR